MEPQRKGYPNCINTVDLPHGFKQSANLGCTGPKQASMSDDSAHTAQNSVISPAYVPKVDHEIFASNATLISEWNNLAPSFLHRSTGKNRCKDVESLSMLPVTVSTLWELQAEE